MRVSYVRGAVLFARGVFLIRRPDGLGGFEFAVLASLRASQLMRGCTPRVDGDHSVAMTALLEVSNGSVMSQPAAAAPTGDLVTVDSQA